MLSFNYKKPIRGILKHHLPAKLFKKETEEAVLQQCKKSRNLYDQRTSVQSTDYAPIKFKVILITNHNFKLHIRDMERDLFTQLKLSDARGFEFAKDWVYPWPYRTPEDHEDYCEVVKSLPDGFKYKLKAAFISRITTSMLDQHYGHLIKHFRWMVEETYLSMERAPHYWKNLKEFLFYALQGTIQKPKERVHLFTLCRTIEPLLLYEGKGGLKTMAKALETFLNSYQCYMRAVKETTAQDDERLEGHWTRYRRTELLIHMATMTKLDDGSLQIREEAQQGYRHTRNFKGYIQCLMNITQIPASYASRKELAALLFNFRRTFLAEQSEFSNKETFDKMVDVIFVQILPEFRDFDHSLVNSETYSHIIDNINLSFLQSGENSKQEKSNATG